MTLYLAALLLAASIAASYGVVSGIDAVVARVTSQPSRVERAAMVYARALIYEVRQLLRDLIREEINEALDERERRGK